ncbi:MAG: DUF262 domain-containing protein [Fusobacteriaceae bacterium]|nr:DUF262 domain-containing protein [Fusobacteriaceae bacterium]
MELDEIEKKFKEEVKHSIIEMDLVTVEDIATKFVEPIYIKPEYQRNIKWSDSDNSLLIESLIMNLPLPSIFLYETSEEKYEIVDGLQRINAIQKFFKNEFKLFNLEVWDNELTDFHYKDLPEIIKRSISSQKISIIKIIDDGENKGFKGTLFGRLNTGGVKLEKQEIRNAIYAGEYNEMLKELAKEEIFTSLINITDKEKKSYKSEELVLRCFTLITENSNTPNKMNKHMEENRNTTKENLKEKKNLFTNLMEFITEIFGVEAFGKKLTLMKYDAYIILFSKYLENKIKVIEVREELKAKMSQEKIFSDLSPKLKDINNEVKKIEGILEEILQKKYGEKTNV